MRQWKIAAFLLLLPLVSCVATAGDKNVAAGDGTNGALLQGKNGGVCQATREWAGFRFKAELSRPGQGDLHVKVDMSETSWDVGVVEVWLETGGKKMLPSQASSGAVINNESSNVPAAVGASGIFFDSLRNRNVGGDRQIGAAVTGTAGMIMAEREAQARKQQFDAATRHWSGVFQVPDPVDCGAKLWVRYWLPGEGVAGRREIDVGHCFCDQGLK